MLMDSVGQEFGKTQQVQLVHALQYLRPQLRRLKDSKVA